MEKPEPRIVVVTGASQGIGYAIAEGFAALGDNVIICGRDHERLSNAEKMLRAMGKGRVQSVIVDVTDQLQVSSLAEELNHRYEKGACTFLRGIVYPYSIFRSSIVADHRHY